MTAVLILLLAYAATVGVTKAASCPTGWVDFCTSCYWLSSAADHLTTWHQAYNECLEKGGQLLVVNSPGEQIFIMDQFLNHPDQRNFSSFWFGLSDKDNDGRFRWIDGTQPQFTSYADGFPHNKKQLLDCGQIFRGTGKWETTDCFRNQGYICEVPCWRSPRSDPHPFGCAEVCESEFRGFKYQFMTQSKKWLEAEADCINQRGHLASIHSREELDFIKAFVEPDKRHYWIGLNDRQTEGKFVWSDGTPADYLLWAKGEPNDYGKMEDCVSSSSAGAVRTYNDIWCNRQRSYLCKKDIRPVRLGQNPTPAPGRDSECGSWESFQGVCYQVNHRARRTWAEAQTECASQGGGLASITNPIQMTFVQGVMRQAPTGVSLWLGASNSVFGWRWTDGSPFGFVHQSSGTPVFSSSGNDCLSLKGHGGSWSSQRCSVRQGYLCTRGYASRALPLHSDFLTALLCQDPSVLLKCPVGRVINIQSAFYRKHGDDVCTQPGQSGGGVGDVLRTVKQHCNNRQSCSVFTHPRVDPCPSVPKCLDVAFTCEDNVCLRGLGVEDESIGDSQLSASSSVNGHAAKKGRLDGTSCWIPSGSLQAAGQWLQVDLGGTRKVTGVVIQGCPQEDKWMTSLKLQHSMDGKTWTDYTADKPTLSGSADRNSRNTRLLESPVSAQYVRVLPLEAHGQTGLRLEVLGCSPDYAITCEHQLSLTSLQDMTIVHCPAGCAQRDYTVYGTDTYRADSNTCAAAIHAGVIVNERGGDCTLLRTGGRHSYIGSTRHSITTQQFDQNFPVSYTFLNGEPKCPGAGWYQFSQDCYKFFQERSTWQDAKQSCRTLGGDLVSVRSMVEQEWLRSFLHMATPTDWDVWLGLNDLTMLGLYVWSDENSVTFTNWAPGKPGSDPTERCIKMLHKTGQWEDSACTHLHAFTCKTSVSHYPPPPVDTPTQLTCPQAVPFTLPISDLQVGTSLCLSGRVLPGASRFIVNLQHNTGADAEIALQFNPRYNNSDAAVVLNSRQNGTYGREQDYHSPLLSIDASFSLLFSIFPDSYKIHINGHDLEPFQHRLPFSLVDHLEVSGDVEIFSVARRRSEVPGAPSICHPKPPVPYNSNIIGGLSVGRTVTVVGTVLRTANSFEVYLSHPTGIALLYSPSFHLRAVVRKSWRAGLWSAEQRGGDMPFVRGQHFTLTFKCEETFFSIHVNGKEIHTFDYRVLPLQQINFLEVRGDVSLTCVSF